MPCFCFHCGTEIQVSAVQPIGFHEACPRCNTDLHACRSCKFYDPGAYNQCREPQAERVVEKDRANSCDYFVFREGKGAIKGAPAKDGALNKLDSLFKK